MHAVMSHPETMRYWDCPPHTQRSQTERFIQDMIRASPEHSDDFLIEYNGKAIGKAGFWRAREVGIMVHRPLWRKGIAREALTAVIPRSFARAPNEPIVAEADPRNSGSLNLLKSLGFTETGREKHTIKIGEEWCDSVYLALTQDQWRSAQNAGLDPSSF